mgnify:CR=1 FL=1
MCPRRRSGGEGGQHQRSGQMDESDRGVGVHGGPGGRDEPDLCGEWQRLQRVHGLDLVVCVAAALHHGVLDADNAQRDAGRKQELAERQFISPAEADNARNLAATPLKGRSSSSRSSIGSAPTTMRCAPGSAAHGPRHCSEGRK